MLDIQFKVTNLEDFKLKVDIEEILDESAAFLISRILNRFMSEISPDGVPWIPSYAGMQRRLKGGTGTLFDTGRLYSSIQITKEEGIRRIGTDVPYGKTHQEGLNGMIRRPFLGFSAEDETLVRQIVEMRIGEMMNK